MSWRGCEWYLVLTLLFLLEIGIQGQSKHTVPAITGQNVSLYVSRLTKYRQITWFFTTDQKIVEKDSEDTTYVFSRFKGRICLHQNGTLQIFNVTRMDSSTYIFKLQRIDGSEKEEKTELQVFDPIPENFLTAEKIQKESNGCFLNLSCVIPDPSVTYTWYDEAGHKPIFQGGVLEITVNSQNYSKSYTCQASNLAETKNDTIRFTKLCEQAPSSAEAWTITWLMVLLPTVLGLLLT